MNAMLDRLSASFDNQRRLLDDAGHELKTPITIVRGHLELIDPQDPADVIETRDLAIDELDRMRRLVDEILMLAKARRPDFVQPEPVVVADLLAGVLDKVVALGDRRWLIEATSNEVVELDPQRITQALIQLVANALKFTEPGAVIALGGRIYGPEVRLWVRDEGTGIAAEDRGRIFERFGRGSDPTGARRARRRSRPRAGHRGRHRRGPPRRVALSTEVGVGSTFTLVPAALGPVVRRRRPGPRREPQPERRRPPTSDRQHRDEGDSDVAAILIAEDEPRIAAFVEKGLRAAGLSTTVARTGPDALDYACSDEFDLMVLDIGLPLMDGFAVLEALRGQGSTLPVIILTARDSVTDTVAGLEGGADDYMAKPFRFEELLARVRIRLRDTVPAQSVVLTTAS